MAIVPGEEAGDLPKVGLNTKLKTINRCPSEQKERGGRRDLQMISRLVGMVGDSSSL